MSQEIRELEIQSWLDNYRQEHRELLEGEPEFAKWLEEQYIPIAGGWLY